MSREIGVIGDREFTTGFRLAGVRRFTNVESDEKSAELDAAVESMLTDDSIGIIVMHDEDLSHLSRTVRRDAETSVEPVLVTLGGGAGSGGLREQIKRAIGIDLMDEES